MTKSLIIVESPAKTKTLKNFLGADFLIEASMGHVRDLPERVLGVNIEKDFEPTYQTRKDRKEILAKLAAAVKAADTVFLASDPDREGEAIAWHLAEALKLTNPKRIQFNEITRQAVQQALASPRDLNMGLIDAQQARRVLDRLIGYKLSPILSKKIQRGLSAGRVQSVALRLICERERERDAFIPEEYWSLNALFTPQAPEERFLFPAALHSRAGKRVEPKSEADVSEILAQIEGANYKVLDVKKRETKRNPSPPFITSTLQQDAVRKLGYSNRRTMSVAQDLYEGIEIGAEGSVGLITYMRTDSVRIAQEAQQDARGYITEKFGAQYLPDQPRQYKTKGNAQDAHEAVRPTSAARHPDLIAKYLNADQLKLYRLIWQRFLASQMSSAVLDVTTAEIAAIVEGDKQPPYIFRAAGSVMTFDGFTRIYTEGKDAKEAEDEEKPPLPPLKKEQPLDLDSLQSKQHFTEPPPRFTEATIVKTLEENGIGRPSTYASIISVLRDRQYVDLENHIFFPTTLGYTVNDQLVKHFPDVVDVGFTAEIENQLDQVEEGKTDWVGLLREFYGPFDIAIAKANIEMDNMKPAPVESEFHCPKTDSVMLLRQGKFGPFLGCSAYPKCKKILKLDKDGQPVEGLDFHCGLDPETDAVIAEVDPSSLPNATDIVCPAGRNELMIKRNSRFGPFLGCSAYPKCRTTIKLDSEGNQVENQEFTCTYSEEKRKKGARASSGSGAKKTGVRAAGKKKTS